MKGIELSKEFYFEYGKPMLEELFPEEKNRIAVGLVGEGSECFGYDDEISLDHDFEAGFCLWITEEDYEKFGFKLERAYSKLPKEFKGYKRPILSPVGGNRHGVLVIEEFYKKFLGVSQLPSDISWWFFVPSTSLAGATNGEVFIDNLGEFSKIREELKKGYPKDVLLKKLAGNLALAGQSGQYNYKRCLSHGELGSASLSVCQFAKHIISSIYLLNNEYEPFYKWAFRKIKSLPVLSNLGEKLTLLLDLPNEKASEKLLLIEKISTAIIDEVKRQNLSNASCYNLETHAYSIMDKIKDVNIRNMHVMDGI